MLLADRAPSHQGVSLARKASWCMFRASPALPTKDAQPGQRLCLFQGSSTNAVSNRVNICVQLKGKLDSQLQFLGTACSSSSGSCTSQKPKLLSMGEICLGPAAVATSSTHCTTSPCSPPGSKATAPMGWLITPRDVHAAALWPGSIRRGFGEAFLKAGAGEARAGSHEPGGSPALAASPLRQLGGVESQCVMEELVLLTRLDHPTSARERQGPLTPQQTHNPVPSSLLPGHNIPASPTMSRCL